MNKIDLKKKYKVFWIELGLQTVHDSSLAYIKRQDTYKNFINAYTLLKKHNIDICVHLIFGLPFETPDMMKETIRTLSPQFSMRRMVKEYVEQLYVKALQSDKIPYDILD